MFIVSIYYRNTIYFAYLDNGTGDCWDMKYHYSHVVPMLSYSVSYATRNPMCHASFPDRPTVHTHIYTLLMVMI